MLRFDEYFISKYFLYSDLDTDRCNEYIHIYGLSDFCNNTRKFNVLANDNKFSAKLGHRETRVSLGETCEATCEQLKCNYTGLELHWCYL